MSERARLVLVTPAPSEGAEWPGALADQLAAAARGGRIDAIIVRLPRLDDRTVIKLLKPIVPVAQEHGSAVLLEDAPALVARSGADGVHLTGLEGLRDALETLRPQERIVGVGGLRARHDAMEAAEAGVDYVMFGEPRRDGTAPPFPAVLERAGWWAEVFETPCVAHVESLEGVEPMAATGCEFVAVGDAVFNHPDGPEAGVREALAAIEAAPVIER
ncbi:thiamine phosphate synthase [uncultured Alsobacter sp.]|uniref:thiamine phosphate synthase n=1 Tax=uncultured Alsobacter sp. TaxID=1748258 RepID=UPI0025F98670|nr:thiamine phosphate synthase [uncultured Alsobacter sp.]